VPSRELTVVLDEQFYLESPRWHEGRVWVSDFYSGEVISVDAGGGDRRVEAEVSAQPSGLGWLPDGRLLVVSMRDGRVLRREDDGRLVTHAELAGYVGGLANDMVVDGNGRAYVGNFGFDLQAGGDIETTMLLRVDPDGSVHQVAEDLWFPNGSVITDDGRLIVGETLGNRISVFEIHPDGSLGPRRDWARFGDLPPTRALAEAIPLGVLAPDGCGLDAEGMVWAADALHGCVVRLREGGEIVETIPAGTGVFACMLGGPDGRTLYVCAAPDFSEVNRRAAREAQLLAVRVDVPRGGRP
jgi:sugar lactone lactonase YvrE